MLRLFLFLWLISSPGWAQPSQPSQARCECGKRPESPGSVQVRVWGGQEARPNEFPWAALVIIRNTSSQPYLSCGGSLLTDRHLLTAAHCMEPGNIFVILGKSPD